MHYGGPHSDPNTIQLDFRYMEILYNTLFYKKKFGAPDRIRTCDLRIRSPLLYPAELRAHMI